MVRQGALRIDVKRGAELFDKSLDRRTLAIEPARCVMKIVHGRMLCQRAKRGSISKGPPRKFQMTTVNGLGQPMIIYTSIARGKSASEHAEQ
jgi:hypothetical protein